MGVLTEVAINFFDEKNSLTTVISPSFLAHSIMTCRMRQGSKVLRYCLAHHVYRNIGHNCCVHLIKFAMKNSWRRLHSHRIPNGNDVFPGAIIVEFRMIIIHCVCDLLWTTMWLYCSVIITYYSNTVNMQRAVYIYICIFTIIIISSVQRDYLLARFITPEESWLFSCIISRASTNVNTNAAWNTTIVSCGCEKKEKKIDIMQWVLRVWVRTICMYIAPVKERGKRINFCYTVLLKRE